MSSLSYSISLKEPILPQLYAQSHVVKTLIQPILATLEENKENKHIFQEENNRHIDVTNQLHHQIPCIVRDTLKADPSVTKVSLLYLNSVYVIHLKKK